jgi:hypothetical protein
VILLFVWSRYIFKVIYLILLHSVFRVLRFKKELLAVAGFVNKTIGVVAFMNEKFCVGPVMNKIWVMGPFVNKKLPWPCS